MTHYDEESHVQTILASQSQGRLAILRAGGIEPRICVSTVDEDALLSKLKHHSSNLKVIELAQAKARDVAGRCAINDCEEPLVVVGADSMLEIAGNLVGKPHTAEIARQRWQVMRGKTGLLHTGHTVILNRAATELCSDDVSIPPAHSAGILRQSYRTVGVEMSATVSTRVHFGNPSERDLEAYIASGEPLEVAGAFTVDGLGGAFVNRLEGDYHAVVGLSLALMRRLLQSCGLPWSSLWSTGKES